MVPVEDSDSSQKHTGIVCDNITVSARKQFQGDGLDVCHLMYFTSAIWHIDLEMKVCVSRSILGRYTIIQEIQDLE